MSSKYGCITYTYEYPVIIRIKGNTMASNARGSNQPDIMTQQEIFGVESGGSDTMDLAPPAPYVTGVEMPGVPMGITGSDIMQGMASAENIAQGPGIGVTSDSGNLNLDDTSAAAGFHMVTTDHGGNGFVDSGVPDTGSQSYPPSGDQQ